MNLLVEIFARKREEVRAEEAARPLAELKAELRDAPPPRDFAGALTRSPHRCALIAEIKRGSPTSGVLKEGLDPASLAALYESAGASCLSVLTDGPGFGGSAADLQAAREDCSLPVLRKDFTTSAYHLYQARAMGADAVLLIVHSLSPSELSEYQSLAKELGLAALFEVHSEPEVEVALSLQAELIGVNNRDLTTFELSLELGERLLPLVAPHAFAVGESAMHSRADVARMEAAGARAVLIGTALSRAEDPARQIAEMMGR
mgnify:CR=1 FL=1